MPRDEPARLMMVGGFTSIYEKAKACGFHLTVAQDRNDVKDADVRLADQLITAPIDDDVIVDLAGALHQRRRFDAVVSFQEHGVLNAAVIRERLDVFGNPLRPVELTRDKARMRAHLRAAGLPSIRSVKTASREELLAFGHEVGWPIILKPYRGSGSRQVRKVGAPGELPGALEQLLAIDADVCFLAEEFMSGPEVSVEAITSDGEHEVVMVTDKLTTGAPHFVELGHSMPSRLGRAQLDAVEALTLAFLSSIGHRHGPSHTEIIVTRDGPIIVESHTRTGGDQIFEMVELATGVDMFAETLGRFAGERRPPSPRRNGTGAAIRFFDFGPGVVAEAAGFDQAAMCPGVVRVENRLEPGLELGLIRMSDDRRGYVLAVGDSAEQAASNVAAAMGRLRVRIR
jgi:biotin carboxylase